MIRTLNPTLRADRSQCAYIDPLSVPSSRLVRAWKSKINSPLQCSRLVLPMILVIPRPRWLWSAYLLGDPPFLAQLDDSKLSAQLAHKTNNQCLRQVQCGCHLHPAASSPSPASTGSSAGSRQGLYFLPPLGFRWPITAVESRHSGHLEHLSSDDRLLPCSPAPVLSWHGH